MTAQQARITLLIADDHRAFGEALAVALGKEEDLEVVAVEADGTSATEVATEKQPDVVLVDLQMPGIDGLETLRRIRAVSPKSAIIILTGSEDELALGRAIQAGAQGFLRKTVAIQELAEAIRRAHRGEPLNANEEVQVALHRLRNLRARDADTAQRFDRLTPRELQILQMLADGRSPEDVATELQVSRNTLRTHIQNILMKLGVHSKLDAIVAAIRHGKVTTVHLGEASDEATELTPATDGGEQG